MKIIGVVGKNSRLGSLLIEKPNFAPLDVDITTLTFSNAPKWFGVDLIVNCEEINDPLDYHKMVDTNVTGLHKLHKVFGKRILAMSTTKVSSDSNAGYLFTKFGMEQVSKACDGKIVRVPPTKNYRYMVDQIEKFALDFDNLPQIVTCHNPWFWGWFQ